MYERGHDNSYRAAFLTASAELNEVFREVEQLRIRKEQVEKVLEALQPLLGLAEQGLEGEAVNTLPYELAQRSAEYVPAPAQATVTAQAAPRYEAPAAGDPIQKRIDSILGLAVA